MKPPASPSAPAVTKRPALPFRSKLFWFCLSLGGLFGLSINLVPMTFKVFEKVFKADYEMQGRTEGLYFVGAFFGALMAGYVTSRFGPSRSVRLGMIAVGAGCLLIGSAQNFLMVQSGSLLMGLGGVWLSVVYGAIVSQHFQSVRQRVFSAVMLTMAVAGTLAPMGMGYYLSYVWEREHWPWWIPYLALAGAFLLSLRFVPSTPSPGPDKPEERSSEGASLAGLLRSPALWLIGLGTVLHGLGQMGAVVWLGRLYESRLGLEEFQVGNMLSANLSGFICGRIFWTFFGGRLADRVLLGCSAAMGSTFYVLTILSPDYQLGLGLMFLAGLGMSGDAVSLGSYTALRFRHAAAKAFAFTQALGPLGAAAGPYIIGFLGKQTGTLEQGVWLIPLTIGTLSLIGFGW